MEKIIQIEYQGRNFSIEESAYQIFQHQLILKQMIQAMKKNRRFIQA